ncbi:ribosomal RNA-processing protein 7 homolog A [Euwallacea fornicatus]|uniref:ribosomal RNA-processing protein 7 homolog A n=1 Tax=Euwallacea fornicatus TaxID=995702 RepID=UPI00338F7D4B
MAPKEIQGFKVVPLKVSQDSTTHHELFIKQHFLHNQEGKPPGRTLLIMNVPPYLETAHIKDLFCSFGNIINILFESNTTNGFKTAYVIFSSQEGLLKALQATSLQIRKTQIKTGLDKWISAYNNSIVDPNKLSKEITSFMQNYDKNEQKSKKDSSKKVDDEGWTVVNKKGHKPGIANKESVMLKINEKIDKKKQRKEHTNYYKFQIKENKMKDLTMLKKNYDEAKKRVQIMKSARKFKPY